MLHASRSPLGVPPRRRSINLDTAWTYAENRARNSETIPRAEWKPITLPHTWNALDATDDRPGYRRDASWYRRTLDLRGQPADARFVLYFEGANTVADVYVNGRRAGGHVGGYVGFRVDVTPFVRRDAPNDVRVRVTNEENPDVVPSGKQDYVIYGGLTRDVWLEVRPNVSIERSVVRTPRVSADSAVTIVETEIANPTRARGEIGVRAELRGPDGRVALRRSATATLSGEPVQNVWLTLPTLVRPRLWSPAAPTLYTAAVTLTRGATTDSVVERVGYRSFRFDSAGAFYLNGERLLIRGTHRHEEMAGLGAALPDARHVADMAAMKAMGANYVRLGHYPQDPAVYRAADSLGILLWDELPWGRGGIGDSAWQGNTRRLLVEQIRQNMGHPSIILWSMGNEVTDVMDAEDRSMHTDPKAIAAFMADLTARSHRLDPDRPTATRKFEGGWQTVDVYSPSIWAGWYGGFYRSYEKALTDARAKYPRFLHMEYGADAHVGRHTETPITGEGLAIDTGTSERVGKRVANVAREGDWSESYQTDLMDWHLTVSERMLGLTGTAQWAFRDFATPLRPENPIPYVNQKGLTARDGTPKDAYYVYKSWWTTNPKFAYIVSHTWTERGGPAGKSHDVRVYSNCASVELVANGASAGVKPRNPDDWPAQGLRWPVVFREGPNALAARCAGPNESGVGDTLTVRYTTTVGTRPDHIVLTARPLPNGHLLVEATLVDAQRRPCLAARDRVHFAHDGAGELLVDRGTPWGSRVIEAANGRASVEMVRPPNGERAVIEARTQDVNGTRLVIVGGR
jgi:beta-galactosidase